MTIISLCNWNFSKTIWLHILKTQKNKIGSFCSIFSLTAFSVRHLEFPNPHVLLVDTEVHITVFETDQLDKIAEHTVSIQDSVNLYLVEMFEFRFYTSSLTSHACNLASVGKSIT